MLKFLNFIFYIFDMKYLFPIKYIITKKYILKIKWKYISRIDFHVRFYNIMTDFRICVLLWYIPGVCFVQFKNHILIGLTAPHSGLVF